MRRAELAACAFSVETDADGVFAKLKFDERHVAVVFFTPGDERWNEKVRAVAVE